MKIFALNSNLSVVTNEIKDTIFAPGVLMHDLAEGLAQKKHEVVMYASKEAKTSVTLRHLNLNALGVVKDRYTPKELAFLRTDYVLALTQAAYLAAQKEKADIIHAQEFNICPFLAPFVDVPIVITCHNPLDSRYLTDLEARFIKNAKNVYLISISDAQRRARPNLQFGGTVYHGIDTRRFKFNGRPEEDLLVTAGRLRPEKGIWEATEVAKKTAHRLEIVGMKSKAYPDYFAKFEKNFKKNRISWIGALPYYRMPAFLARAKAYLFPIKWEEPFGLVMIEAMACGTPVIAFNRGSAPEIIEDGKTGFICENVSDMVNAVKKLGQIDRAYCRRYVEEKFSLEKMTLEHEKLYRAVSKRYQNRKK